MEISDGAISYNGNNITTLGDITTGDFTARSWSFERTTAQVDNTVLGNLQWRHPDGEVIPVIQNYARIAGFMEADDIGSEDGSMQFFVTEAGVHDAPYMEFNDGSAQLITVHRPIQLDNAQNIQWVSSLRSISSSAAQMSFAVEDTDTYNFLIDGTNEMIISQTELDLRGNRLNLLGGHIRFSDDDTTISQVTNDLEYDVATANSHRWRIADATEMELTASLLLVNSNIEAEVTGNVPQYSTDRPEVLADNSLIGRFLFSGFDSASAQQDYAMIEGVLRDDLTPDGAMLLRAVENNAMITYLSLEGLELQVNIFRDLDMNSQDITAVTNLNGTAVSDYALATGDTYTGAHLFAGATIRVPVAAAPTIAVNGDFAIDTTITDFTTPLIRYFGTESMVVIAVPTAEIDTAPGNGDVLAYNATTDEFEFVAAGGGAQTPWASTIDAADFSLTNLDILDFNERTDAATITAAQIYWEAASGMHLNVPTGDIWTFDINGAQIWFADLNEQHLFLSTVNL